MLLLENLTSILCSNTQCFSTNPLSAKMLNKAHFKEVPEAQLKNAYDGFILSAEDRLS